MMRRQGAAQHHHVVDEAGQGVVRGHVAWASGVSRGCDRNDVLTGSAEKPGAKGQGLKLVFTGHRASAVVLGSPTVVIFGSAIRSGTNAFNPQAFADHLCRQVKPLVLAAAYSGLRTGPERTAQLGTGLVGQGHAPMISGIYGPPARTSSREPGS